MMMSESGKNLLSTTQFFPRRMQNEKLSCLLLEHIKEKVKPLKAYGLKDVWSDNYFIKCKISLTMKMLREKFCGLIS